MDERQPTAAPRLAEQVTARENLQYTASLNSDERAKAERLGYDPGGAVLSTRLTDAAEDGRLFGFRF